MATKYLHGAYPGGYTLGAAYTGLDIEAGASVGGTGVHVAQFATIQNDGVVEAAAGYNGITLQAGGVVTNGSASDVTALIEGASGIFCGKSKSLILDNFGTIVGMHRYGVVMYGGTITNGSASDTTALITGRQQNGIWAGNLVAPSNTVINYGTVTSANQDGILLDAGGMLTNGTATDRTALIKGVTGLLQQNGDANVVTNYGTIAGTDGLAVMLSSNKDVLRVEAGCAFVGDVWGGYGLLDLASGTGKISALKAGAVTVSGSMAATTFSRFGAVEIAVGASFQLVGANTISGAGIGTFDIAGALTLGATTTLDDADLIDQTGTVDLRGGVTSAHLTIASKGTYKLDGDVGIASRPPNAPTLLVDGLLIKSAGTGTSSVAGTVSDDGTIEAATGTLDFTGSLNGTGSMKIGAGATLGFARAVEKTLTASFAGSDGTLALDAAAGFGATIAGFAAGDTIDLIDTAATGATVDHRDQLVITDGATTVATLQLSGSYSGDIFTAAPDGRGGTAITLGAAATEPPPVHAFVASMAGMTAGPAAAHASAGLPITVSHPTLVAPRAALA